MRNEFNLQAAAKRRLRKAPTGPMIPGRPRKRPTDGELLPTKPRTPSGPMLPSKPRGGYGPITSTRPRSRGSMRAR